MSEEKKNLILFSTRAIMVWVVGVFLLFGFLGLGLVVLGWLLVGWLGLVCLFTFLGK